MTKTCISCTTIKENNEPLDEDDDDDDDRVLIVMLIDLMMNILIDLVLN